MVCLAFDLKCGFALWGVKFAAEIGYAVINRYNNVKVFLWVFISV